MTNTSPSLQPGRPFAERASLLLQKVAIEAAIELVASRGWANTRMSDVAKRAGVSKPTLYKHLGSKDELAAAIVEHEVNRVLALARQAWDRHPNAPVVALREGLRTILKSFQVNPLVRALMTDNEANEGLLVVVLRHRAALLDNATKQFRDMLDERLSSFCEADRAAFADTIVRLIISQAILPSTSVEEALANIERIGVRLLAPTF